MDLSPQSSLARRGSAGRSPARDRALVVAAAILALVAAAYAAKSVPLLARAPVGSNDLHQRWLDQHYVLRGQNPYDVLFGHDRPAPHGRDARPDPVTGPPLSGGYPGWSFFTGYALFALPWSAERLVWTGLTLASMGVLAGWGWTRAVARGVGFRVAAFAAAGTLAIGTFGTSTSLGQFTAPLLAAVVVAEWVAARAGADGSSRGRRWTAACVSGMLLGAALSKPQVAAPFLAVHLVRGRWGVLVATAGYIAVASGVIWFVTRTDPLEMARQMLDASATYLGNAYGPPQLLARAGMPLPRAMLLSGLLIPVATAAVLFAWADAPVVTLYAVAAVGGRLWTYHKLYDNPMVLFLLVALTLTAAEAGAGRARVLWAAVAAVGLTLWLPPRLCDHAWFQVAQLTTWVAALAVLLRATARTPAAP